MATEKTREDIPTVKIMSWVAQSQITSNSDRIVLWCLILRSNSKNNYGCWPSFRDIGQMGQLHPETVKRCVRRLVAMKQVTRTVRANSSNYYRINIELIEKQANDDLERKQLRSDGYQYIHITEDMYDNCSTLDELKLTKAEKKALGAYDSSGGRIKVGTDWNVIEKAGTCKDCDDTGFYHLLLGDKKGNRLRIDSGLCNCQAPEEVEDDDLDREFDNDSEDVPA